MSYDFFQGFTNSYSLSKTLRFELIPIGNTLANIEKKGLISRDDDRAVNYKKVKKIIDGYHKHFIELALKEVVLSKLNEYSELYFQNKEVRDDDNFKAIKDALRKEIVSGFNKGEAKALFARIDKKELIKEDLIEFIKTNDEDRGLVEKFRDFTTYFGGFHENRKNMYSDKEQSTAIAYRIIHENLPKFVENIKIFQEIKTKCPELDFSPIYFEMQEVLDGELLEDIFTIEYFNNLITQKGIEFINNVIGGKSVEGGNKIKGLNEYINLYNQTQNEKNKKAPKFKQLYKQILSDRTSISFLLENYENDAELLDGIDNFYKTQLLNFDNEGKADTLNIIDKTKELLASLKEFNLNEIYLRNDTGLTNISVKIFGDWSVIKESLSYYYNNFVDANYVSKYASAKTEKAREALEKKKATWNKDYITIADAQKVVDAYIEYLGMGNDFEALYTPTVIADYFKNHYKTTLINEKEVDLNYNISEKYKAISGLLGIEREVDSKSLLQEPNNIEKIKFYMDALMDLFHFVKPLHLPSEFASEKDNNFYTEFETYFVQLSLVAKLYDKVRNYLTQKPYSTEKIKLNFDNAQLLGGWDENKEPDYLNTILQKDGFYYLAIMDKKNNQLFNNIPHFDAGTEVYEKMKYKLLPGVNKMLPKVFFAKSNIDYFKPSDEIQKIRNQASHSKNGEPQGGFKKADFSLKDCHAMIDFFKQSISIHEDWKQFGFKFSSTESYQDLSGFYREVESQGYKIIFDNVPVKYIDSSVEKGDLYLFKIYSKDFSSFSKGKPNLHTLYWKALFEEQNLANVVYKLNGQAELFYRKSSIDFKNKVVHNANQAINNKNPLAIKKKSLFGYDIIKDRRFTVDKFQFHVPITLNFKANGSDYINQQTNEFLRNNPDVKIIGLDRGERHLIYLTLIDQKGNIIIQESLNTLESYTGAVRRETPYQTLLDNKEKERDAARKSWGTIENIKELKEGYLSQVVHKIATMMVEHNAIVVMEDLNFGFKRGRFKVDKQVYQKLEKMLIDKLNYLIFKNEEPNKTGGLYKALQLTNKFTSFKEMGKQSGFLYYVPAWNTSKIDPVTGFVDFLKPKYESVHQSKDFFSKFDSIRYNKVKGYFEFAFNYKNFTTKAEGSKTQWTVCTYGAERFVWNKNLNLNKGGDEVINITEKLKELFEAKQWNYLQGEELKTFIAGDDDKNFFLKLTKYLGITLSLRYSSNTYHKDFILSPMADEAGNFFYSEEAPATLPKDADANGAYHIALKGLWVLQQLGIQKDLKKLQLAISNKEWLQFVQEKDY